MDPPAPMTTKKHCMTIAAAAPRRMAPDPGASRKRRRQRHGDERDDRNLHPGHGKRASATYPDNAHTTAARERAKRSLEHVERGTQARPGMTSLFASSRAATCSGSRESYALSASGASAVRAMEKSAAKYTAFMRLSAARPAAADRGDFKSASDGDVFTAPPMSARRQRRAHLPSLRAERTHRDDRVRLERDEERRRQFRVEERRRQSTFRVEKGDAVGRSLNSRRTWVISAIFRPSLLASRRTYQDGAQDGAHASEEETPQHSPRARDDASQVGGEQQKRNREGQEKLCHVRVRGRRRRDDADVAEEKGEEGGEEARAADARAPSLLVAPQAERRRAQDGGPHAPRIGGLDEGPGDGREALAERARADGVAARAGASRGVRRGAERGAGRAIDAGDAREGRARAGRDDADAVPRDVSHRRAAVGQAKATAREDCAARRDRTVRATRRGARRERDARNDVRDARDGRGHHACARGGGMTRARAAPREPPRNRPYPPRSRRASPASGVGTSRFSRKRRPSQHVRRIIHPPDGNLSRRCENGRKLASASRVTTARSKDPTLAPRCRLRARRP